MKLSAGFYKAAMVRAIMLIALGGFLGLASTFFLKELDRGTAIMLGVLLFTLFALFTTLSRSKLHRDLPVIDRVEVSNGSERVKLR